MPLLFHHTRIRCNSSILKFATCAVQIRYKSTFRKAPIRGINTLSRYFHIQYTLSNTVSDKSRYLIFARRRNLIQWHCDTVNLAPPFKYFMTHANSCKACKTKAQQKLNKADENCEIKQQFLRTVTFILVTENNRK
jgi:hypothetical protein